MKKICILSAVNLKHMSMISVYTEELKRRGIGFDLIYMDKYDEVETSDAENVYRYVNIINPKLPKYIRGLKYFKFFNYAKRILERNNYDFIIVWNDVAIFLFGLYLSKKWKGKYCLNIRDYCHQKFRVIFKIFEKAIYNSSFTTISSPGFQSFLPEYNYIHLNSLNRKILKECKIRNSLRDIGEPIRLTFVGNVRFFDNNKKLLDIFKNDSRFELHYYGTHAEKLESYAKEFGITNAYFNGSFPVDDTAKYIGRTDIINNLYGHGSYSVDYALSIKLYYGIYCKLPILVEPDTYMETITKQYGMSYVVDGYTSDLNDKIYEWYRSIDFDQMSKKCDVAIKEIDRQDQLFYSMLAKELT